MATSTQQNPQNPQAPQSGNQAGGQPGSEQRSEGLLPVGNSEDADEDGRFEVAEEVNLDQQSDALRHVGQLPDDHAADDVLPDPAKQSDG